MARTPPRGRQGQCSAGQLSQQGQSADRADAMFTLARISVSVVIDNL